MMKKTTQRTESYVILSDNSRVTNLPIYYLLSTKDKHKDYVKCLDEMQIYNNNHISLIYKSA